MPQSLDAPLAKQFKTHGEQIALLRERGMRVKGQIVCFLSGVSLW